MSDETVAPPPYHLGDGSISDPVIQGVGSVVFILYELFVVFGAVVFYYYRDTPFVKARSRVLLILFVIANVCNGAVQYSYIMSEVPCMIEMWLDSLFVGSTFWVIILMAYRLFLIFNLAKQKLEVQLPREERNPNVVDEQNDTFVKVEVAEEEEMLVTTTIHIGGVATTVRTQSKSKIIKYLKFWQNYEMIDEWNMLMLFFGIEFTYLLVNVSYTLYWVITGDLESCMTKNIHISDVLVSNFAGGVVGVIAAIAMRNCHDAYFVKGELKACGIWGCIGFIPVLCLAFVPNLFPYYWFNTSGLALFAGLGFIFFCLPACILLKQQLGGRSGNPGSTFSFRSNDTSSVSHRESSGNESDRNSASKNYLSDEEEKKITKLLKDPLGVKMVEDYLVHYQCFELSGCLQFWQKIKAFKKLKDKRQLGGNVILIYQKYLKPDAYIHVDLFTEEQLIPIQEVVNKLMNEDGENEVIVDRGIFNDLLNEVQEVLKEVLFPPFFRSPYYRVYLEKVTLEEGIKSVA